MKRRGSELNPLCPTTGTVLREDAVKSLRTFKSDDNIALLKSLLSDVTIRNENRPDGEFRVYFIRRAAYDVLSEWGTKVEKPPIEERVSQQ